MRVAEKVISVDMPIFTISEPTRICLVCERKEEPLANAVYTDKAWLCGKCKAALLKVVEETEKGSE